MKQIKQKGMSLIEVILVLVVGTFIIIGGLAMFDAADSSQQQNTFVKSVQAIQSGTRAIRDASGYGTASLNDALIKAKKVPSSFAVSGTTINTNYSGSTLTVTGTSATTYDIAIAAVPQDACIAILTASNNFATYKIGTGAATATPANAATAATACAAATQTVTLSGS